MSWTPPETPIPKRPSRPRKKWWPQSRSKLQQAEEALANLAPDLDRGLVRGSPGLGTDAEVALAEARETLGNLELDFALESAQAAKDLHDARAALEEAKQALTDFEERGGGRLVQLRDDKAEAEADLEESQQGLAEGWSRPKEAGSYGLDYHISRMEQIVDS